MGNYFLNNIINTRDLEINDRLIATFLNEPISDGGHWFMLVNIIEKYGLIPKEYMTDSTHGKQTKEINDYINSILKYYAFTIRNSDIIDFNKKKKNNLEEMLNQIYKI